MIVRIALTLVILLTAFALFMALRKFQIGRVNNRKSPLLNLNTPALLVFSSEKCAPCAAQELYLDKLRPSTRQAVAIDKIDVDQDRETAERFGIFTLPSSVLLDRKGQVRHINYGLTTAARLEQQLEKLHDNG